MKNYITDLAPSKAGLVVGIAFITSVFIVTIVDDLILANFVVPGDTSAVARDIESNRKLFGFALVGYLLVLVLDSVIGLALYAVLRSAHKNLAALTAILRLLYAGILIIGLLALAFQIIDVYSYASIKLIGYLFFSLHIFILGYSVIQSGYIPKSLGILLMIASFTYIVFFVDFHLPETLKMIIMFTMLIAELSLSIWLVVKRNRLPKLNFK